MKIEMDMKKIIFAIAALAAMLPAVRAQEEAPVRIPSGYRAFVQQETLYRLEKTDDKRSMMGITTTHGFYFNDHCYIGIGFGFVGGNGFFAMPVFTSLMWNMSYSSSVSPLMQVRLGSYLGDGNGAYGDFGLGVLFGSKKRFAVNVMAVFSFYEETTVEERTYDAALGYHIYNKKDFNPTSAGLRIGIEF